MGDIVHSYSLKRLNLVKNTTRNFSTNEDKLSLIASFEELVIYHSIDDISTSGYITLREQGNLIKFFPIEGLERLDVEFAIDDPTHKYEPYKRSFYIYAVDSMTETGDTKMYTLRFADLAALINVSSRLEQRYTGKAEEIIKSIAISDIFTKHEIKNINNDDDSTASTSNDESKPAIDLSIDTSTQFQIDLISPAWKPFDFIKRICSSAVSTNGTFNDCLFFQQTDGKYIFTDYLTLFKQQPLNFKKYPQIKAKILDKYTIIDYSLNTLFNTQAQAMTGMFGIVSKIYDVSTMSVQTFINYYCKRDINAKNPKYSGITVDELSNIDQNPNYIDKLMEPYTPQGPEDPRFKAIKQSPAGCINVSACGFDETAMVKAAAAAAGATGNVGTFEPTGSNTGLTVFQTPKYTIANGIPCKLNMRTKSAVFFLNKCTDLKLGYPVEINMKDLYSEKADKPTFSEFLNGKWYIGKIKYALTLTDINVEVECYSTSVGIVPNSNEDDPNSFTA